jgi:hypothetical protein
MPQRSCAGRPRAALCRVAGTGFAAAEKTKRRTIPGVYMEKRARYSFWQSLNRDSGDVRTSMAKPVT